MDVKKSKGNSIKQHKNTSAETGQSAHDAVYQSGRKGKQGLWKTAGRGVCTGL